MTEEVYLGIDTSCYTTSLFFMDREGQAAAEARRILKVKPRGCGLQQSEMLYQHTRNLPELMEEAARGHRLSVRGIGVSARPRPREDSYMPAFLAGLGAERAEQAGKKWILPLMMVLGTAVLYTVGTAWFMIQTGNGLGAALGLCVLPFLPGDAAKIIAAALLADPVKKAVRKMNS